MPSVAALVAIAEELGDNPDELLALAEKAPRDLGQKLRDSPNARLFYRSAVDLNLSEAEWEEAIGRFEIEKGTEVRFWRNEHIESRAEERLAQLATSIGRAVTPPVPVDHFIEHVLELDFLWDKIEERAGEMILGAINPKDRQIVMNDTHAELFHQKEGLERFTKLHEAGHWDLLTDHASVDHPRLLEGKETGLVAFRHSRTGLLHVLKALCSRVTVCNTSAI